MGYPIPAQLNAPNRPKVITLTSPITGQLTVYAQNRLLNNVTARSVLDTESLKIQVNDEFYANNIDSFCTDVRHYSNDISDFVEVETYIPDDTAIAAGKQTLIAPAIIALIIGLIKMVILAAAIIFVVSALAQLIPQRPKLWAPNPTSGEMELMDRESAISALQYANPGVYVDPNTGAVIDQNAFPSQQAFKDYVEWYDSNLPEDWMSTGWDIGGIATIAIVAVGGIAAIYLGVKFLGPRLGKQGG